MTKFYLPCPHCELPIRGQASGIELEDHSIQFECDVLELNADPEDQQVVTVNPYVPALFRADSDDGFGAFPTMTLLDLLGDRVAEYFTAESIAQDAIDRRWPEVQRFFRYYLDSNWPMYERIAPRIFDGWEPVSTSHERTTGLLHG